MIFRKNSRKAVLTYCRMIREATGLGVPLDDILAETKSFHGENFTSLVINELKQV